MAINSKWYRFGSLVVAAGVLVASSWPSLSVSAFGFSIEDKLLHALVYALLAYLAYRGWAPAKTAPHNRRAKWVILIILACFAAADEYHQRWIPGRFVEWGDFLADAIGVLTGFVLATWHTRRHPPLAPFDLSPRKNT